MDPTSDPTLNLEELREDSEDGNTGAPNIIVICLRVCRLAGSQRAKIARPLVYYTLSSPATE